ncbi:MAG TPA: OB-fold domain-containing protein [Elusimicrobiota bacterium]|nr:OB-fold domain-containing protein [Elusimicrobiota bacterium]
MDIYAYKCRKCGHVNYPYRLVCKKCRGNEHEEFDPVPLPKKGRLLTFTRLHTLPADFLVATLSLGIVELENGVRITGQLNIPEPAIGMKVKGEVEPVRTDEFRKHYGMVFSAEEGPAGSLRRSRPVGKRSRRPPH